MTLNSFFQISVIIFCTVATIFMLILFVWLIKFRIRLNKLIQKLEEISEIAKTTTLKIQDFLEETIESLETFKKSITTFKFIGQIITEIIKLFKNNKEGSENGQEK